MTTITIPEKTLFRPDEVASILEINLATVYRRIQDGTIKTFTPLKPYRIPRQVLLDLIDL